MTNNNNNVKAVSVAPIEEWNKYGGFVFTVTAVGELISAIVPIAQLIYEKLGENKTIDFYQSVINNGYEYTCKDGEVTLKPANR